VDARLLANDVLALAAADYNAGYAAKAALGVTHTREILFVNREYWVVSDVLRGKGRHRIEQNFQYTPGLLDVKDGRAVTGHADANLAMLWLWPAAAQARAGIGEDNPSCGWYSSSYGRVEKAPHLELSAELQLPARVTLVLYPFKGAKAPALNAESLSVLGPDAANAAAVSVTIGGRKDIVLLSDPRASPAVLDSAGGVPLERKPLNAALIRDGQTTVLSP
jgi:hypothetical protein